MFRRPRCASIFLGMAMVLATATGAVAKDDAIASLDDPLPLDAQPGSEITVGWTVEVPVDEGSPAPFNAEGMFIRLIPNTGEPVESTGHQDRLGHYIATITIPPGGLRDIELGLRGESCANGTCQRSDLIFALAESPLEAAGAAPAADSPSGSASNPVAPTAVDLPMLLVVLAGIAILSGIAATILRNGRIEVRSTRT